MLIHGDCKAVWTLQLASMEIVQYVPGATDSCSNDRALDAGASVTGALPCPSFVREIREQSTDEQSELRSDMAQVTTKAA